MLVNLPLDRIVAPMSKRGSIMLKIIGGVGVAVLSFWATLRFLDYFPAGFPFGETGSNYAITMFGNATSSAPYLAKTTRLQFRGGGYAQIQDTKGLLCRTFLCNFSMSVEFSGPTPSSPQLIVGQSYSGERGWHLLLAGGQLVLQIDGGEQQIAASFAPDKGRRYVIDILSSTQEVKLSVDGVVIVTGKSQLFTDINRDITIGGRAGSIQLGLFAEVTNVQISRQAR